MKKRNNVADARWSELKAEIQAILVSVAKARQLITYSELTSMLQTAYVHYHSQVLVRLLTDVGMEESTVGHPPLPALVVTKQTRMPGGGFFKSDPGEIEVDDPESYWRAQVEQVYDYWSQH